MNLEGMQQRLRFIFLYFFVLVFVEENRIPDLSVPIAYLISDHAPENQRKHVQLENIGFTLWNKHLWTDRIYDHFLTAPINFKVTSGLISQKLGSCVKCNNIENAMVCKSHICHIFFRMEQNKHVKH